MFVISNNTWQECGILGKQERDEAHTSWAGKEMRKKKKVEKDDKTDPDFISRTLCPFELKLLFIKVINVDFPQFLQCFFFLPMLSHQVTKTLDDLDEISVEKNAHRGVTVNSRCRAPAAM